MDALLGKEIDASGYLLTVMMGKDAAHSIGEDRQCSDLVPCESWRDRRFRRREAIIGKQPRFRVNASVYWLDYTSMVSWRRNSKHNKASLKNGISNGSAKSSIKGLSEFGQSLNPHLRCF